MNYNNKNEVEVESMRPIKYISIADLKEFGYSVKIVANHKDEKFIIEQIIDKDGMAVDRKEFEKELRKIGMCTNKFPIELEYCHHRTLSGKAVTDFRIVCPERLDKNWTSTAYCSNEAKTFALRKKFKDIGEVDSSLRTGNKEGY